MIVEIAEFISACPALNGKKVCVNFLDGEVGAVSVELETQQKQVRHYADGSGLYKQRFYLAVRGELGKANEVNYKAQRRCEKIEHWIDEQNSVGNLPVLGECEYVVSLDVIRSFVPVATGSVDARYEAELELVFYKF